MIDSVPAGDESLSAGPETEPGAAAPDRPRTPDAPIRVFLLDDHELLRRGLRDLLEREGDLEVVGEAGNARQGVGMILALRPDVALLDVQLPDGSGVEVCRQVRSRDPGIRALMLTTFDDAQARMAAVLAGASGFVLKQIRGTELVTRVRRVAAGEAIDGAEPGRGGGRTSPASGSAASGMSGASGASGMPGASGRVADDRLRSLTPQERRVLDLIVEGLTNGQIGERLGIGEKTVRNHVTNLLAKLGLSGRTQAAVYAVKRETGS